MDKKEYKLLSDEIMMLIANEQFQDAADIADRIDWRKVRSFSMLMKISELYQLNRRYDDALELMLMAYDHSPKNRTIVYSLCELYILVENPRKAWEFMELYKKMAPNDLKLYILRYKLGELTGASIDDQIGLLEEYNRKDFREEWAYQLAYLYHRIGLGTKCVETCDELITWFGEGPFVIKAMELKMLHAKLKPEQQAIYDRREDIADQIEAYESDEYTTESAEPGLLSGDEEPDFRVKTIDMGKFNTINLQKALAESMRELMGGDDRGEKNARITGRIMKPMMEDDFMSTGEMEEQLGAEPLEEVPEGDYPEEDYGEEGYPEGEYPEEGYEDGDYPEGEYPEDEYPEGEYAEGEYPEEDYNEEEYPEEDYPEEEPEGKAEEEKEAETDGMEELLPGMDPIESVPGELASEPEGVDDQTIFFGPEQLPPTITSPQPLKGSVSVAEDEVFFEDRTDDIVIDSLPSNTNPDYEGPSRRAKEVREEEEKEKKERERRAPEGAESRTPRPSKSMDNLFYLGEDGQLGLAVPDRMPVEKQITGQIHINEYLAEWERTKKRRLEQHEEELQRSISERTGPIFKDYDKRKRNSMIEEVERQHKIFSDKYQADDIELRSIEEVEDDAYYQDGYDEGSGYEDGSAGAVDIMGDRPSIWDEVDAARASDEAEAAQNMSTDEEAPESSGPSIWDEVDAALEAEKQEAVPSAAPTGFVDAAVGMQSGLASTGDLAATRSFGPEVERYPAFSEDRQEGMPAAEAAGADAAGQADGVNEEGAFAEAENTEGGYAEGEYAEGEYVEGEYAEGEYAEDGYYEDGEYAEGEYAEGEYVEGEYVEGEYAEDGYYEGEYAGEDYPEGEYEGEAYAEGEYPPEGENAGNGLDTARIEEIAGVLEADADRVGRQTVEEINDEYQPDEENELSNDEQKLFADFLYSKKMRDQLLTALDQISLASYVGNVIITGENEDSALSLGKALIKEIQMIDGNFTESRIAKISGTKMNRRDIPAMFKQLENGALLVEQASNMNRDTSECLVRTLESMTEGIFVILMDKKKDMERLLSEYEMLNGYFNARIDIAPMNNNALVDYAKKYAYSLEYKIDEERGVLALHQRISELQIGEHNVTKAEIEDLIDAAIEHSKRARIGAFFQVLGGKRYDYEDMIILREKDFQR